MKKSKFQLMQKLSTIMAIGILMLQTLVPAGIVFADNIDTNSVETVETSDTSALETQPKETPATTGGDSKALEQPVTPTEEGTGEASTGPEADDAQEEPEGDEGEDPDPATDAESTSDAEQKSSEQEKVSDEKEEEKEEEKEDSDADKSDIQLFNVGPQRDLGDIFSLDYMRIDGEDIEDGDFITIVDGTKAELRFKWDTENLDSPAKEGDTATLRLSDAFKQLNIATPRDIIVDGVKVGEYTVVNGSMVFLFNENIEQDNVRNGFVEVELEFDLDSFRENRRQEIPFEYNDGKNMTIEARPHLNHSGIEKDGNPDSEHDAREITWSVEVLNTADEAINDATLNDTLPSGLGDARDFVIRKLTVDFDGNVILGEVVEIPAESFPVVLGTIQAYEGYQVEYKTTIENYAEQSFTNNAEFYYQGIADPLPAEATVSGLTRSNPIEKNGSLISHTTPGEERIRWTIDVNKNGQPINEAIVEDSLPEGLAIVPGSIEVYRITKNGDDWTRGEDHSETFTEFSINLGQLTEDDTYRIEFETTIDWSEVNAGEYKQTNSFNNIATLFDGETEFNDDDATVEVNRPDMLEKIGVDNVDYVNKTITWTVTLNKAKQPLGEVTVTDILPKGVSLNAAKVTITGDEGNDFSNVTPSITPGEDEGTTKLEIYFSEVGTETITITYTTDIEDFTAAGFTNVVGIDGVGIGEWGDPREAIINPRGNSYGKGYQGIHYGNKTIDWRLTVDPRREAIQSLIIEDSFPNKGLIALPDSFTVTFAGQPLEEGEDYTLSPRTEGSETGYHKGFIITIIIDDLLPLDGGQLVIDYKTSYDRQREVEGNTLDPYKLDEGLDDNTDGLYINRVQYTGSTVNGHLINQSRDASQRVREDSWNSGKKEGKLISIDGEGDQVDGWVSGNERKVAWDFYFNYLDNNLGTGVVVRDDLQYEGEIDLDSVVISVYDVAADGGTNITGPVLDPSSYNPKIENGELVIEFGDFVVDKRYVVTFTTSVPNKSIETYTNEAFVKTQDSETPLKYEGTVHYDRFEDFLSKSAVGLNGNQVYTGDEVNWQARVNDSLSIIEKPVVTDTISAGHVYINDSLEVSRVEGSNEVPLVENTDYTLTVNLLDDDKTALVVNLNDRLEDALILRYKTVVTEIEGEIGNDISLKGEDVVYEEISSENLKADEFSRVGGEWSRATRGAIRLTKEDAEEETVIANNEATFTLWYDLNGELVQFGEYTTTNGLLEIENLPFRTYYLREETAPEGYVQAEEDLEFVVNTANDPNNFYLELTFENTKEKIDITGTKEWVDGETVRPDSVQLQLFSGETPIGDPVTVEAASDWAHTWTELDRTNIEGTPHEYRVDEVDVPDNFEKSFSDDGLTVINTFESPKTSIPVEKKWDDNDNQDGIRPDNIEIELRANGDETEFDNLVLNDGNNWQDEFTELPALDNRGVEITYTLEEMDVPEGYVSQITGDAETGFIVTNTQLTEVSITKEWEDEDDLAGFRPEHIEVELYADGEATGKVIAVVANEEGNWEGSFINLPKYRDGGIQIDYTVVEVSLDEDIYSVDITPSGEDSDETVYDYTLTNTHEVERVEVNVTKEWEDEDDLAGFRPNYIEIELYANGEATGKIINIIANEEDEWEGSFINLIKYQNGEIVDYTIKEVSLDEELYSVETIAGEADSDGNVYDYTLVNSHEVERVEVNVTKEWEDDDNISGFRPEHIEVELYADGEATGKVIAVVANEEGNWEGSFINLPKYRDGGIQIDYTVVEVSLDEDIYSVDITPSGEDSDETVYDYTLTNTHDVEYITIEGHKEWNDANNQDGNRPEEITVNLLANGFEVAEQVVTVDEEGNWNFVFENLPKFINGEEATYTFTEDEVENYSTEIDGFDITNSYTPEERSITVTKAWDDANNQDGLRPDAVEVQLYANGATSGDAITLSADNNWTHTWTELAVNETPGEPIEYTIEEVDVPEGYTVDIDDENLGNVIITNSHTPEQIDITGTKTWDDANNQDGIRPESIIVELLADGEVTDTVEVTEEDDWTYNFTELPKFKDQGIEINYEIREVAVDEYQVSYDIAENVVNITNTYNPGKTSIDVLKVWNDSDNRDGIRPDSINVRLLADGEVVQEQEVTEEMGWRYIFTDLDEYKEGEVGQLINYTVEEIPVEGYETSIKGSVKDGFVITNSHTPEKPSKPNKQKHGKLPQTGETATLWISVVGLVVIAFVGYGYVSQKRKR